MNVIELQLHDCTAGTPHVIVLLLVQSKILTANMPPRRAPPRPLGAGISTPHRSASLEIRGNHQETLLQLVN